MKTSDYESRIYEMSNQIKALRERLVEMEEEKVSEMEQQQESKENREEMLRTIRLLKEDNEALRRENLMLRERVNSLEAAVGRKQVQEEMRKSDQGDVMSVRSARSLRGNRTSGKASQVEGAFTVKNSLVASSHKSVTTILLR